MGVDALYALVEDGESGEAGVFGAGPDGSGAVFHDVLQVVGGDVAGGSYLECEVAELLGQGVVGEESVAVGGYPDDASGVVHDVVAFHVDVVQLVGRAEAEGLYGACAGVDVAYIARAVVDPVVASVVGLYGSAGDVELGLAGDAAGGEVEEEASGGGEDDPVVVEAEGAVDDGGGVAVGEAGDGGGGGVGEGFGDDALAGEEEGGLPV